MKSVVALIPARRGSKGIVGKNIRHLAGKPLIAYSIEAALGAKRPVEVLISTDDPQVKEIARSYGIQVEYERPAPLATDQAGMAGVVTDALQWVEAQGRTVEDFILLQPTSPFRTANDVDAAIDLLQSVSSGSILGVSPMLHHPFECVKVMPDHWEFLVAKPENLDRRQDYVGEFHFINGAMYGGKWQNFKKTQKLIEPTSKLLVMDAINSIDIDSELDFQMAEALMSLRQTRN